MSAGRPINFFADWGPYAHEHREREEANRAETDKGPSQSQTHTVGIWAPMGGITLGDTGSGWGIGMVFRNSEGLITRWQPDGLRCLFDSLANGPMPRLTNNPTYA
ncbi:hypothetical protein PC116_g24819 [Phytophthora cactorum]|uniref:Uncharacterized protein n=1 Tax=Phytophthora cactorum TaxID=29920 RepID=A0A8T1JUJ7_9STRA|nr:hypothetical protein PC114_g26047 [Phytophthora cactorum]KAG2884068.1 hypothetical protein PC117_g25885 [Phytophthora cactorum]KAG2962992.1 hypothetical protein PC119_g25645 [Phytophthora cactorum]KAG2982239.1 hypothetical protein PC120_g24679 [Phytophthora cactorum]KAG3179137.1 hypothetical protein C6341_g7642 [Phytophthora cactorum]